MLLNHRHSIKRGERGATEMDPIDAPRIFFIAAICVLNILRKDKEFIGPNFVGYLPDLIPSISIHAIENEIFRQPLLSVGIVARSVGVITEAGNVELLKDFVVQHLRL